MTKAKGPVRKNRKGVDHGPEQELEHLSRADCTPP